MNEIDKTNPLIIAIDFFTVIFIAMFAGNPILSFIAFCGAECYLIFCRNKPKFDVFLLLLFLVTALINPLISHNGVTIMFVMNDQPITFEALIYGMSVGLSIIATMCWFKVAFDVFSCDKINYILGAFSPKTALLMSMTFRFLPLYLIKSKEIDEAQKAFGIYTKDNLIDTILAKIRIFSTMVTWSLENGIVTADSMAARGFGVGRRTNYSDYHIRKKDAFIAIAILSLSTITIFAIINDCFSFVIYPEIIIHKISKLAVIGYISYSLLAFLPVIIEVVTRLKWKFLMSRI